MCYCDAETASFQSTTYPRSAKERHCYECESLIPVGERYARVAGKWDYRVESYAMCLGCDAWGDALSVAQRRECGEACWQLGAMWSAVVEFCEEHLGYRPIARATA
jgi:hypothetical protein